MSIRNDNLPEMAAALWLDECQSERGNDFRYGDDSGMWYQPFGTSSGVYVVFFGASSSPL